MQNFPHHYTVTASGRIDGDVDLQVEKLPPLRSGLPTEFDGRGDQWSPETLLVAAVGDCFVLTFQGVARASRLAWTSLACDVTGTLERIERATQFTGFEMRARLTIPFDSDHELARRALEKAERSCLITTSLKGTVHFVPEIGVAAPVGEPTVA